MQAMLRDFDSWIARARLGILLDADLAALAITLAASGDRLADSPDAADLASTGGPGSLSTLWSPPSLVAAGFAVPKLGVPGRPAGGVDILGSLGGYRVAFDRVGASKVLERCRYVHMLAGRDFAPADAAFFSYRQRTGAQALPALAISSLLAKKLAMGVRKVGLEVRVAPHGNFGSNFDEARANAHRFCNVARLVGIEATCLLTDGREAQQPYLGRGEAILAVSRILDGSASEWLASHAEDCRRWADALGGTATSFEAVAYAFVANLEAQGGSFDALRSRAAVVAAGHSSTVASRHDGYVSYDLGKLRDAIIDARQPDAGTTFADDAGIVLLVRPGTFVSKGEPLASIRCRPPARARLCSVVAQAIDLAQNPGVATPHGNTGVSEVVRV